MKMYRKILGKISRLGMDMERELSLHLRIEDAGVRLHDADRLIERLQRKIFAIIAAQNSSKFESKILWMQFCDEIIGHSLLLACWDLDTISCRGQVADNAAALRIKRWCPEYSTHELDGDWFGFFIGKGEDSLSGFSIDELNAEDLRSGE
jgi:hypothetical protein